MAPKNRDSYILGGGLLILLMFALASDTDKTAPIIGGGFGGGRPGEEAMEVDPTNLSFDQALAEQQQMAQHFQTRPGPAPGQRQPPQSNVQSDMNAINKKRKRTYTPQGPTQRELNQASMLSFLKSLYEEIVARTKVVWDQITKDERERGEINDGTTQDVMELCSRMTDFLAKSEEFYKTYGSGSQEARSLQNVGDNVAFIKQKLNLVLTASRRNKEHAHAMDIADELEALQDALVRRWHVERMQIEFGRGLSRLENDPNNGGFIQGGARMEDTEGNHDHQHSNDQSGSAMQGTANNAMDPGEDDKTNKDPHTIANPSSVHPQTHAPAPSNLNSQHSLENLQSGPSQGKQKGAKTPTIEDLLGEIGDKFNTGGERAVNEGILKLIREMGITYLSELSADQMEEIRAKTFVGEKRKNPSTGGGTLGEELVSQGGAKRIKVMEKDEMENTRTEFNAEKEKHKQNEPETIAEGFDSGGVWKADTYLHVVNENDWAVEWFGTLTRREKKKYSLYKSWLGNFQHQTTVNETQFQKIEATGNNVELIRQQQQPIQKIQQELADKFKIQSTTATIAEARALDMDGTRQYDADYALLLATWKGALYSRAKVKNTLENAAQFLHAQVLPDSWSEDQRNQANSAIGLAAHLICMFKHVAFHTDTALILGKRQEPERSEPVPKKKARTGK